MPFRIALSGINASAAELQVIGNNVANAGTTGFKNSRAEFADIYATTNLGISQNAIGSGVRVAAVSQQFSQGNVGFTNNNLDLAINGQGFFVLSDNGVPVYTRAGAFQPDRDGYIVNSQNQRLTVFQADANGNITGSRGDLRLNTADIAPNPTTAVEVTANLDANAKQFAPYPGLPVFDRTDPTTYNNSTSVTLYDSLGNAVLGTMYYRKTTNPNEWESHLWLTNGAGAPIEVAPNGNASGQPATMMFSSTGNIASVTPSLGGSLTIDYAPVNPLTGAVSMSFSVNYSNTTQYGSPFGVNALTQDGYATGRLSGIDINDTGVVEARYTNGQTRALGQIALANFSNPQGLRQLGDTAWAETYDSGAALVGAPGTASLGLVQSGALEGSNVDLTEQLVNMIVAQRNFQANAQVITTADTITQTIINIR
ncbi:MAG: flagellar hook protein FlgE [Gammaproteobacteria bacterium]|nr:flagellar hook protein FlgE [Gammaproteobacteria bacterium]